jgi:hypothetical protein
MNETKVRKASAKGDLRAPRGSTTEFVSYFDAPKVKEMCQKTIYFCHRLQDVLDLNKEIQL